MRIGFSALSLVITLLMPATAQAVCSIEQRIELAKVGYDKAEVERLCSEAAVPAPAARPQVPQPASTDQILSSATYDGYDPARGDPESARTNIGPERRCQFHKGYVRLKGSSKFIDVPDGSLYIDGITRFEAEPTKGLIIARISLTALGFSYASERCWALFVLKYNVDADGFAGRTAEFRREYDQVLQALAARGIRD
jgi:hypothetical protein